MVNKHLANKYFLLFPVCMYSIVSKLCVCACVCVSKSFYNLTYEETNSKTQNRQRNKVYIKSTDWWHWISQCMPRLGWERKKRETNAFTCHLPKHLGCCTTHNWKMFDEHKPPHQNQCIRCNNTDTDLCLCAVRNCERSLPVFECSGVHLPEGLSFLGSIVDSIQKLTSTARQLWLWVNANIFTKAQRKERLLNIFYYSLLLFHVQNNEAFKKQLNSRWVDKGNVHKHNEHYSALRWNPVFCYNTTWMKGGGGVMYAQWNKSNEKDKKWMIALRWRIKKTKLGKKPCPRKANPLSVTTELLLPSVPLDRRDKERTESNEDYGKGIWAL